MRVEIRYISKGKCIEDKNVLDRAKKKSEQCLLTLLSFNYLTILQPNGSVSEATGGTECRQGSSCSSDDDAEDDLPKILLHKLMVLEVRELPCPQW